MCIRTGGRCSGTPGFDPQKVRGATKPLTFRKRSWDLPRGLILRCSKSWGLQPDLTPVTNKQMGYKILLHCTTGTWFSKTHSSRSSAAQVPSGRPLEFCYSNQLPIHTSTPQVSSLRHNVWETVKFLTFLTFFFPWSVAFHQHLHRGRHWSLRNAFNPNAEGRSMQFSPDICFPRPSSCLKACRIRKKNPY